MRARRYLPAIGRFSTVDPEEGVPGTTTLANPYHYADNDPVNRLDVRPAGDRRRHPHPGRLRDLVLVAELAGHRRLDTTRRDSLPIAADKQAAIETLAVDY